MRTNPAHIVRALHEYGDGASFKKVKEHLKQHDKIKISRWAIRKWVVKYSADKRVASSGECQPLPSRIRC
ncbi:MAG TPA: hypothetical protein VJH68_05615 [Candidatus Nanoarchaeia archaeon]|nr:hypothetical protein [Candidatus Nanoarchaeia archaeon]